MTATMPDRTQPLREAPAPVAPEPPRRRGPRVRGSLRRRSWPRPRAALPSAPRRQRPPADPTLTAVSSAFTMLALLAVWVLLQLLVLGGLSQQRAQDLLYAEFRGQLASGTAPVGPIVPVGDPVALIEVPELDLSEVVVEGTSSGDTLAGPGHKRDSVLPGQVGTSVVYGRAATYGGPFGRLPDLQAGDVLTVTSAQGELDFRVLGVRRTGDPLPQPRAEGAARLTLVTAEGSGRLSALAPGEAVYVDAEAAKGFPAPPGLPPAVPASEEAMATDGTAYPLLTLVLALLVALAVGVAAARHRWSAALVWVVSAPVGIALAWQATDVVMRLLPNLV